MKREWNERASENARHHVAGSRSDWDERSFSPSGAGSVQKRVLSDPLVAALGDLSTKRMVEIGCGVGRMTEHLAGLFGEVHAVDVSGELIRRARERLAHVANVVVHETSGADLGPLPSDAFDLAFSFVVFQDVPFRDAIVGMLADAHRVLKPGGLLKFQVQGCVEHWYVEAPKDTWTGVSFSVEETAVLAAELGFDVLRTEGAGTQYFWNWWRRRP